MRILLHEHYTAGGDLPDTAPAAEAEIARALVAALAVDLGRLDTHEVRLSSPRDGAFDADLEWAEAALVLAPETDDLLTDLATRVEQAGVLLLGASAAAVRLTSDRMGLTLALGEADLPVPRAWLIDFERLDLIERITGRLGFPVVVKPVAGASGHGTRLVQTPDEIPSALAAVRQATAWSSYLLQEYRPGLGAGVGLVVAGGRARPLGLWGALVSEPPALVIERVATPLDHPQVEAAVSLAERAALAIPGLTGYVEVDLVLAEDGPVVLKVRAGLSLGTLALRRSRQLNLARVILDAALHDRPPDTRLWTVARPVLVERDQPGAALAAEMPFN